MDQIIKVQNVDKTYKLYSKPIKRILHLLLPFYKGYQEHNVLRGIDFDVERGEIIGIVGKNGAGKSTLLKMITGVAYPTSGTIKVDGRISSLLELGTGFNLELSGYENIILFGQLNGFTKKEMLDKMEEIIDFADIGDYINQPVKLYSSGMFARLAFSVSINIDPDILIVDEILSVGDAKFQVRSFNKFLEFKEQGKTIIFVSHSLDVIKRFCTRVIWIESGCIKQIGNPSIVVEQFFSQLMDYSYQDVKKQGTRKIELCELLELRPENQTIKYGESNTITIQYKPIMEITKPVIRVDVNLKLSEEGKKQFVCSFLTSVKKFDVPWIIGQENKVHLNIPRFDLAPGIYDFNVSFTDAMLIKEFDKYTDLGEFKVDDEFKGDGLVLIQHNWS
jgi:teichoic acid transport system ATP-binding protein